TRHFAAEGVEVVRHFVGGVFQLEHLALDIDGDLLRQVAVGDGGGDAGDVTHLRRQAARHGVDVVGQVLPRAGYTLDLRLAAELGSDERRVGNACGFAGVGGEVGSDVVG